MSQTFHEDELLPLSGVQHLVFCERQAALIHVERLWLDNPQTVEGTRFHEVADRGRSESRGPLRLVRGVAIRSLRLGLAGRADVIEFHRVAEGAPGVPLPGQPGHWSAYPVEYKRGRPKTHRADEVQLCAQAMCLEEMLSIVIDAGALFYGRSRRRVDVVFDGSLRRLTEEAAARFHKLIASGATPRAIWAPKCVRCSLVAACRPRDIGSPTSRYLSAIFRSAGELSMGEG